MIIFCQLPGLLPHDRTLYKFRPSKSVIVRDYFDYLEPDDLSLAAEGDEVLDFLSPSVHLDVFEVGQLVYFPVKANFLVFSHGVLQNIGLNSTLSQKIEQR